MSRFWHEWPEAPRDPHAAALWQMTEVGLCANSLRRALRGGGQRASQVHPDRIKHGLRRHAEWAALAALMWLLRSPTADYDEPNLREPWDIFCRPQFWPLFGFKTGAPRNEVPAMVWGER